MPQLANSLPAWMVGRRRAEIAMKRVTRKPFLYDSLYAHLRRRAQGEEGR
jgi:hypothetical protein